jgi:hypothetical protein
MADQNNKAALTDISKQLREYAGNNGYSHNDYADTMRAAADEIDRYYGGMMNWKRTAEAKGREEVAPADAVRDARNEALPLNEHTRFILGRPNFTCIRAAQRMRELGHEIESKAEAEQAAVIHLMLTMYREHGESWLERCNAYLAKSTQKEPAK